MRAKTNRGWDPVECWEKKCVRRLVKCSFLNKNPSHRLASSVLCPCVVAFLLACRHKKTTVSPPQLLVADRTNGCQFCSQHWVFPPWWPWNAVHHCSQTFNLKRFASYLICHRKKGIKIIDQFTQEPNWSMRYIIKRRLLIGAEARWVKCLLQRRGPDQSCYQCGWIGPHLDQCVIEPYGSARCSLSFCGRRPDWKSDSQRCSKRTRLWHICSRMESKRPTWALAASSQSSGQQV